MVVVAVVLIFGSLLHGFMKQQGVNDLLCLLNHPELPGSGNTYSKNGPSRAVLELPCIL